MYVPIYLIFFGQSTRSSFLFSFGGVWCAEARKFVAINGLNKIDVYDLETGQIWSPESPNNVTAVESVHCGRGFVTGSHMGQADVIDILECLILQTLQNDISGPSSLTVQAEDSQIKVLAVRFLSSSGNFF